MQKLNNLPTDPCRTIMLADTMTDPPGNIYYGTGQRSSIGGFCDRGGGPMWNGRIFTLHGYATWHAHNSLSGAAITGTGVANVAFYDGHCESMYGPDLYHDTATQLQNVWDQNWNDIQFP
jgi:prepilin-type processing-associated H-X9-DG protein